MAPLSSKFHISRNFVKIKNKIFQQVIYLAMTAFLCPWQYVLMWFTHMKNVKLNIVSLGALFTKFLTPGLTRQLCNTLDVWLKSTSPTNHPAVYTIRGLTRELKSWWIRPLNYLSLHTSPTVNKSVRSVSFEIPKVKHHFHRLLRRILSMACDFLQ